jgi:anti-sigma B factor antagonist
VDHDRYALSWSVADVDGDSVLRFGLVGEIDMAACKELSADVVSVIMSGGADRVVVDLGETVFLDSRGISLLITAWQAARDAGIGFALVNARGVVRRVLEVSGLMVLLGGHRKASW